MNPKVRYLYKALLYMGKDYPSRSGGFKKFRLDLKSTFRNTPVANEYELEKALQKGEYVIKGMFNINIESIS